MQRPTLDDVRRAAEAIRGAVERTRCARSRTLSEITGAGVVLKFENLQFTASFKDRGSLVKLLSLTEEERAQGVIAMSAGNHAQAVAYHARRLGIPATIVMPRFAPSVKVEHTRGFGAEVILHGEGVDEAADRARKLAAERKLVFVHPYDDPRVIAGQGTIALEMLDAFPDLDALVIPVGGGGLISGNAIAAKALRAGIEVIGVETERFPSMRQALAGEPIECGRSSIAEGIAVKEPGALTREIVRDLVDDIVLVREDTIERAVLLLLEVEKTLVEGAGAVGLAALLQHRDRFTGREVGLILSGGNIDLLPLSSIIHRGLVRSGRLARLFIDVRDVPGSLAAVAGCIADAEGQIIEIHHQRTFAHLPLEFVELELVVETRGHEHRRAMVAALEAAGYRTRLHANG